MVEGLKDLKGVVSSIQNILREILLIISNLDCICITKVEKTKIQKAHLATEARKMATCL